MHERSIQGDIADLQAASLETLMKMVVAGFGTTLLPALALKTASAKDRGIMARQLQLPDTWRRASLVFRRTFPRRRAFVELVLESVPDSVHCL